MITYHYVEVPIISILPIFLYVKYTVPRTLIMRKRQRAELGAGIGGIGKHFLSEYGVGVNLKNDKIFEICLSWVFLQGKN